MNTEKTRLDKMLSDNKISQEDYHILATALKRKSFFAKMHASLWLNPFQRIAGVKALIIGVVILILTSYVGVKAGIYYLGPLSLINATALPKQSFAHPFLFLIYQNTVAWITLSLLFIIAAKMLQKGRVRIIDFLGTTLLGRFPILMITLSAFLIRIFFPEVLNIDVSKGLQVHGSIAQYLFSILISVFLIWQGFVYFYAFKESSGLTGKKLWWGFLGAIVLSEFIAMPINTFFMS